jgi:hypothetical protein
VKCNFKVLVLKVYYSNLRYLIKIALLSNKDISNRISFL